jgi:6-pyruvoyltetrahydropterin/6-carboxytetrahydropterin synthase
MEHYQVRIANDYLVFSAGHFITVDEGTCEALHGHDYRVTAAVSGPLDENHYVIDFGVLRRELQAILEDLDHRVLLPTSHPQIRVTSNEREVTATFADRRWVFPRNDCRLLPVPNTTTELLAHLIGQYLRHRLEAKTGIRPALVRIELSEGYGQSAICELRTDDKEPTL